MAERTPLAPADFDHLTRLARNPRTSLPAHTARALSSHGLITWKRGTPRQWAVTELGHVIASGKSPIYRTYSS